MKLKSTLAASLFAALAALVMSAQAAPDIDKATAVKAPASEMQGEKKMRPHSHVEAKTAVPQNTPGAKSDKPNPAKDKSRHYHPRDGK